MTVAVSDISPIRAIIANAKSRVTFVLMLCFFASGCSPLSEREKWLLGGMVAAHAADAYTTIEGLRRNGDSDFGAEFREINPILGDYPDRGNVILFKAAVAGGFYLLGEIFPDHREGIYTIGIFSGAAPATWNWSQIERYD